MYVWLWKDPSVQVSGVPDDYNNIGSPRTHVNCEAKEYLVGP